MTAPHWFVRPLTAGDRGYDVAVVQRKLGVGPDGTFAPGLTVVVRGFQAARGVEPTGRVDEDTAGALGEEAAYGRIPDWYGAEHAPGVVADLLGVDDDQSDVRDALKRFQGNNGLPVTGVVDEQTARVLGDRAEET